MSKYIVLLLFSFKALAQSSFVSCGKSSSNSEGSFSFSIGQIFYDSSNSNDGAYNEGVQHAFETLNLNIDNIFSPDEIIIYPNPTTNYINIIATKHHEMLNYSLIDLKGKLLVNNNIINDETLIDISVLSKATYLLYIHDAKNNRIETIKIIKN